MLIKELGLQLYSLRDHTDKDFCGAVEKVAKMGYTGVEFAGYFGLKPAEMAKLLSDNGLKAYGAHFGALPKTGEQLDTEIEMALACGYKYLTCPGHHMENRDDALRFADILNETNAKLKPHGLRVGYHNHAHEFVVNQGEIMMETVLKNTEPEVYAEFDVFWVAYAGYDPLRFVKKYSGRIPVMHLKELGPDRKSNVECGAGVLPFDEIIIEGLKGGTEYFIVEQEEYTLPTLESCKVSFDNIMAL